MDASDNADDVGGGGNRFTNHSNNGINSNNDSMNVSKDKANTTITTTNMTAITTCSTTTMVYFISFRYTLPTVLNQSNVNMIIVLKIV